MVKYRENRILPNESTQGLKVVVVELRVAGVCADNVCDVDETGQHDICEGNDALPNDDQHPHHTPHEELVLLHLFRSRIALDELENVLQEFLRQGDDVGRWDDRLILSITQEKCPLHGNCSVRVHDVIWRCEMLDQDWKHLLPLLLGNDAAEIVKVLDRIHFEDRVNSIVSHKIRSQVLLEKVCDAN